MPKYGFLKFYFAFILLFLSSDLLARHSNKNKNDNNKITLLFYDRTGKEMSFDQVKAFSNNSYNKNWNFKDGQGYDNDAILEPNNLRSIQNCDVLFPSGSHCAFNLIDRPVAFALDWPTEPLGYSLLILDNGAKGFSQPATINFTYQAALDSKKHFDIALVSRPDYKKSEKFNQAYAELEKHLALAAASNDQSVKGVEGQLALDNLAIADGLMLSEYGLQMAKANKDKVTPWIALTIDIIPGYKENIDMAAKITQPYGWIRIVFDPKPPSDYKDMVAYAKSKGLKILGQPVDSSYDKKYSYKQYVQRFKDYIAAFPDIDAWEVGNEINGNWLTSKIPQKVDAVAAYCKSLNKMTVLTFFYEINTGGPAKWSTFTWINDCYLPATSKNIDVVFLSLYEEQAPLGISFDRVMTQLKAEFPNQKIGLGELGYWNKGQRAWWTLTKENPMHDGILAVAEKYYPASFAYENSVGGCFWWNFIREFKSEPRLQEFVSTFRNEIRDAK